VTDVFSSVTYLLQATPGARSQGRRQSAVPQGPKPQAEGLDAERRAWHQRVSGLAFGRPGRRLGL
jgi:hypothetical protein